MNGAVVLASYLPSEVCGWGSKRFHTVLAGQDDAGCDELGLCRRKGEKFIYGNCGEDGAKSGVLGV